MLSLLLLPLSIIDSYLVNLLGLHGLMIDGHESHGEFSVGDGHMREPVLPIVQILEPAHAGSVDACLREVCCRSTRRELMDRIALVVRLLPCVLTEEELLIQQAVVGCKKMLRGGGLVAVDKHIPHKRGDLVIGVVCIIEAMLVPVQVEVDLIVQKHGHQV